METLAAQFAALAEKFGPSVFNAAIEAARVEAYSSLASSAISGAFSVAAAYAGRYIVRRARASDNFDSPIATAFGYGLLGLATILAAATVWTWIDPWTWVAMNHPELWLAKRAFKI